MAVTFKETNLVLALSVVLTRIWLALVDVQLTEAAFEALGTNAGGGLGVAVGPVGTFLHLAVGFLAVDALEARSALAGEVIPRIFVCNKCVAQHTKQLLRNIYVILGMSSQSALLKQGLFSQVTRLMLSHLSPTKSSGHVQLKEASLSVQVPLLRQGEDSHSLMSNSQLKHRI